MAVADSELTKLNPWINNVNNWNKYRAKILDLKLIHLIRQETKISKRVITWNYTIQMQLVSFIKKLINSMFY